MDEAKLCRKGLHPMTPDNILIRKVTGYPLSDGTKKCYDAKSCRACYNFRMKHYMQGVRDRQKAKEKAMA
jgi:hypothetical protein